MEVTSNSWEDNDQTLGVFDEKVKTQGPLIAPNGS